MAFLFGGGSKSVSAPTPPTPTPPPSTQDTGAGDAERKKLRRRSGRKDTFLVGDLTPSLQEGKKGKLG